MPAKSEYKVSVRSMVEAVSDLREELSYAERIEAFDRCVLGVSLEDEHFTPSKLASMATWISSRFTECDILLGDAIHRLTLEMKGISKNESLERSIQIADEVVSSMQPVLSSLSSCKFNWLRCTSIQQHKSYEHFFLQLCKLYVSSREFALAIDENALSFVTRQAQGFGSAARRNVSSVPLMFSAQYLLEELAIFSHLVSPHGKRLFLYPGKDLSIVEEIAGGRHPDVPKELHSRVSARLELRSRRN